MIMNKVMSTEDWYLKSIETDVEYLNPELYQDMLKTTDVTVAIHNATEITFTMATQIFCCKKFTETFGDHGGVIPNVLMIMKSILF